MCFTPKSAKSRATARPKAVLAPPVDGEGGVIRREG